MRWPEPARRHWGILLLLVAFLALGTVYSVVTPLFEASDELWHYPFVKHLADGGRLPVQDPARPGPWRQEGSQPPLYYWLAGLITRWVPSDDLPEILVRNPHADIGLIKPDGNANMVIHTPREAFPYRGAVLAVHLARGFSVVLGALTVLFTYLIGLEVLPRRPELALAAAAVVAFTPMFLFISGSVNNDNLLVTLSTASVWLILRLVRRETSDVLRVPCSVLCRRGPAPAPGEAPQPAQHACPHLAEDTQYAIRNTEHATRNTQHASRLTFDVSRLTSDVPYAGWLLLGAVIGLAALSKVSGLALLPLAALGLAWVAWRRRDWRLFFWGGVCVVGAAALVAGWWYYRNWRLYCDPLGFNVFVAIVGARVPQPTLRQLLGEWQGFVMAYWGFFGGVNVAAPAWFYRLLNGLALAGAGGLIVGGIRWLWQRRPPDPDTALRLGLMAFWPLLVSAALVRWTLMTIASQGRLIFPAIASLSYLMVLGWGAGVKCETSNVKRQTSGVSRLTFHVSRLAPYVPAVVLAVLAVWTPLAVIAPAYAQPPRLTPAEVAAIPNRLDLAFGDSIELLGYRMAPAEVRPGQQVSVTLFWRARAPVPVNYSVFVQLLTENDLIIGQRDVYPGRGSFPTTLWRPGEAFADTYIVPVSATAFSPSQARVVAGLYELQSGARLAVCDGQGRALGDHVRLGDVLVRSEPREGIPNPVYFNLDNRIALVGYDMDRTALRPGETLRLTLFWKALCLLDKNYTVFTHVLGPGDSIWAQKDAWPQDGAAPTSTWQVGQVIRDPYDLTVKPETPGGVYEVEVGMYLGETLERLGVLGSGGHLQDSRILLNRVRVVRP